MIRISLINHRTTYMNHIYDSHKLGLTAMKKLNILCFFSNLNLFLTFSQSRPFSECHTQVQCNGQ